MKPKWLISVVAAILMLIGTAVPALASWGFVTVDAKGNRKAYGPYDTQRECERYRSFEATTDRWRTVTTCEETSGLSK
ncbi:MAG: hypothetical protein KGL11_02440 [Alphaproteobacteria bacterium]|nr:hypothetical protein [Alphaproteobacteria bacterium]